MGTIAWILLQKVYAGLEYADVNLQYEGLDRLRNIPKNPKKNAHRILEFILHLRSIKQCSVIPAF